MEARTIDVVMRGNENTDTLDVYKKVIESRNTRPVRNQGFYAVFRQQEETVTRCERINVR